MRDMTQMSLWLDPDDAETIIWSDFDDVQIALGRLGVPLNVLMQALQEGETSRNDRTPHDAPTAPGFIRWNTALRSLSDSLVPQGWSRNDKSNWPNLVHPKSLIALAIASGNKNVGNPDFAPSTKFPKGKKIREAVACNATQLTLLPEHDIQNPPIWYLLYYVEQGELRSELSLPIAMDDSGFIRAWTERIILPRITGSGDGIQIIPEPSFDPDIDIDIVRRA
jgi:hypothetical protein